MVLIWIHLSQSFTQYLQYLTDPIKNLIFSINFQIPDEVVDEVEQCNDQLKLRDGELLSLLKKLATILSDEEYMAELLEINNLVVQLSAGT